jgi:hypothetical protein
LWFFVTSTVFPSVIDIQKIKGHEDQTSRPFVSFVVRALTLVFRVNLHLAISHGCPAVAPTDVRQAVAVALIADAPAQVVVAACTCYVPAAAAELA